MSLPMDMAAESASRLSSETSEIGTTIAVPVAWGWSGIAPLPRQPPILV
ncbi:hypothetical protein OG563_02445 [Nocardia vinacea]|uniref:Uncharacterized protein n=1 Tax=Nocardia vinacea TaxID=96468 RepID=A0ABZ1YV25_9NOCA|nr:hypothetical protein [Nocardia vinacea]